MWSGRNAAICDQDIRVTVDIVRIQNARWRDWSAFGDGCVLRHTEIEAASNHLALRTVVI
jgi:hypothetical protein